ncbi:MAG: hypothetical protein O3A19_05975 [Planctomycetota bacterium]|nr:hypothetical protein [Planctomycetota bacterium]MDA1025960.1 hypothetical protein [Planctomycetota bacterium]
MRDTPESTITISTNPIPIWSSRFTAAGCLVMLVVGFAWASPAARHGISLLGCLGESRTLQIEGSPPHSVTRLSAAEPDVPNGQSFFVLSSSPGLLIPRTNRLE